MIHDGFQRALIPRYDLDKTAHLCARVRLRHGYCVVLPIKGYAGGSRRGIEIAHQDGVPTAFAVVVAVSGFDGGVPTPIGVGDIIVRRSYAGQPIHSPTLGCDGGLETLAPMERSTRGLQIMSIRDAIAVI